MTVKKICSDYFGQEGEATKKEVDKRWALNVETKSTFFLCEYGLKWQTGQVQTICIFRQKLRTLEYSVELTLYNSWKNNLLEIYGDCHNYDADGCL